MAENECDVDADEAMDVDVDNLYYHIIRYLRDISLEGLSENQADQFAELTDIVSNLENMGDLIKTDLVNVGLNMIEEDVVISPETHTLLLNFHYAFSLSIPQSNQSLVLYDL